MFKLSFYILFTLILYTKDFIISLQFFVLFDINILYCNKNEKFKFTVQTLAWYTVKICSGKMTCANYEMRCDVQHEMCFILFCVSVHVDIAVL